MKVNNNIFFVVVIIFFTSFLGCSQSSGVKLEEVKIIEKPINSEDDIMPINGSPVIPYVYTSSVSLNDLPVDVKKKKFFEMMLPAVMVAKKELSYKLKSVKILAAKSVLNASDSAYLEKLKAEYEAKDIDMLEDRLHTFPVCIVLAQSAIESGWGTSRFFLEANNPFGLWSFDPNEERIEASSSRNGEKVYLRKFNNLEEAIDAYYTTLATGGLFAKFRAEVLKTNDPFILVNYLMDYSERREAYVEEVKAVIRGNNLVKFDSYKISPEYLIN